MYILFVYFSNSWLAFIHSLLDIIVFDPPLLSNHNMVLQVGSSEDPSASASVKLRTVTSNMTHPQFQKFCMDWSVYTTITRLPTQERTIHLYNACDPTVQHSLINSKPNFLNFIEKDAIDIIKPYGTSYDIPHNPARRSESIQDFLIHLQAASLDREFSCPG